MNNDETSYRHYSGSKKIIHLKSEPYVRKIHKVGDRILEKKIYNGKKNRCYKYFGNEIEVRQAHPLIFFDV
jgi:hypothetical protein